MVAKKNTQTADMSSHVFLFSCLSVVIISGLISQSNAIVYREHLDIQEMELLFGEDGCIDGGTISVSEVNPVVRPVVYAELSIISEESKTSKNKEVKSPMMQINELALFNNIPFEYTLIREDGPSHSKQFTVSLKLGEEEYVDESNSIKNAKHGAAKLALERTQYHHPPLKSVIINSHKINKNPVEKLEAFVSKDKTIKYTFKTKSVFESSENHDNNYHKNMYSDPTFHEVTVTIGHLSFIGEGLTSDSAKQQAANNALTKLNINGAFCSLNNNWHAIIGNYGNKCPISLINEFAVNSKLKLNFDCTDEEGPAHDKMFTIKCGIGKFESVGKGATKKAAKNEAAVNMLKTLKSYAYANEIDCSYNLKKDKKKQKAKSIVKSSTFVTSAGKAIPDNINPVSKLMEFCQKSYNKHPPIFKLLEENSTENKLFLMQVKVGELLFVGSGKNKKIAKRKAAEGMLKILRYSGYRSNRDSSFVEKRSDDSGKLKNNLKKPLTKSGLYLNLENFFELNSEQPTATKEKSSMKLEDNQEKGSKVLDKDNSPISKNKPKPKSSNFKSPMLQLEKVSQTMGFRFQFSDFPKSNSTGFVSLLSLTTEPPKVCFDTGETPEIAQDNVATKALAYLQSYLDVMPENVKKLTFKDYSEDWFQLDDLTVQEETITEL